MPQRITHLAVLCVPVQRIDSKNNDTSTGGHSSQSPRWTHKNVFPYVDPSYLIMITMIPCTVDNTKNNIAILGDRWWPQKAKQEGNKQQKQITHCMDKKT